MLIYTKIYRNVIVNQTTDLMEVISDLEVEDQKALASKFERLDEGKKGFIYRAFISSTQQVECWRI